MEKPQNDKNYCNDPSCGLTIAGVQHTHDRDEDRGKKSRINRKLEALYDFLRSI